MSLTQSARSAVAAVLHAGEGSIKLPEDIVNFLHFMSDGCKQWSGAPLDDATAVNCVLSAMWLAPAAGTMARGVEVTVRPSNKTAWFWKSGVMGYSIVRLATGQFEIRRDDQIELVAKADADSKSPRRPAVPQQQLARTG